MHIYNALFRYKMKKNQLILWLFVLLVVSCQSEDLDIIELSGEWSFELDSLDRGVAEKWFDKDLSESIHLPGSMAINGKGEDVSLETKWTATMWDDSTWYTSLKMKKYREEGNLKVPFWLTPEKVYLGAAWYQKKVMIPKKWKGQEISLFLERVHWESSLWIDSFAVGKRNSLSTPHQYKEISQLTPGEHTITLRIDNSIKDVHVGLDAHSISDNTQTNWNGIIGTLQLKATPTIKIEKIRITPNIVSKSVHISGILSHSRPPDMKRYTLEVQAELTEGGEDIQPLQKKSIVTNGDSPFELIYPMGDSPLLWDEFHPNSYTMNLSIITDSGIIEKKIPFGMNEFKVVDKTFQSNGKPVFLRGTLECAIFPLTGYPPMNKSSWIRIFKKVKDHGLNHVRFHSWCPPEAAFMAADELGLYLQIEAAAWTTIGNDNQIDEWLYTETMDILDTYGNHPSFVMMAYGNEPHGDNHKEYLKNYLSYFKQYDSSKVYTGGAGWPYLENADYFNDQKPRIQHWNENLNSVINKDIPNTNFDYDFYVKEMDMPLVSHEMGQWCVYPNFREMTKYSGVLKPKNFEIFQESLMKNKMGHLADSLVLASGKLQTICYKADIEAALRTKTLDGFQLLDLHDFPGQGTAPVGVLDAFWDEKGYVTPEEYRAFCNKTVPLARMDKRVFYNDELFEAEIEIANYGGSEIKNAKVSWTLTKTNGEVYAQGKFPLRKISIGSGIEIGSLIVDLKGLKLASQLKLSIYLNEYQNDWNIWVYPRLKKTLKNTSEIMITSTWNVDVEKFLGSGGSVLMNIDKGAINSKSGGDIGMGFSTIFWNTSWTQGQKPHTLGILCSPEHPALAEFPTSFHSDWQWWDAMSHSNAIILQVLGADVKPIVRVIDDWFENRPLALIFEAKVGPGKLLFSGIDLHSNLDRRPEARQLLYSLKKYMVGNDFNPKIEIKRDSITKMFVNNP